MFLNAAKAQSAEDSVKAVINKLFAAMKNSDAASLKAVFADSAILQSISRNKEGKTVIQNDTVDEVKCQREMLMNALFLML